MNQPVQAPLKGWIGSIPSSASNNSQKISLCFKQTHFLCGRREEVFEHVVVILGVGVGRQTIPGCDQMIRSFPAASSLPFLFVHHRESMERSFEIVINRQLVALDKVRYVVVLCFCVEGCCGKKNNVACDVR